MLRCQPEELGEAFLVRWKTLERWLAKDAIPAPWALHLHLLEWAAIRVALELPADRQTAPVLDLLGGAVAQAGRAAVLHAADGGSSPPGSTETTETIYG